MSHSTLSPSSPPSQLTIAVGPEVRVLTFLQSALQYRKLVPCMLPAVFTLQLGNHELHPYAQCSAGPQSHNGCGDPSHPETFDAKWQPMLPLAPPYCLTSSQWAAQLEHGNLYPAGCQIVLTCGLCPVVETLHCPGTNELQQRRKPRGLWQHLRHRRTQTSVI